jgi:hypothetical protein
MVARMRRAISSLLVMLLADCPRRTAEQHAPELRLGFLAHDPGGAENGMASIAGDVLFTLPDREKAGDFQRLVPRLQLGAILNTAGRTSLAHAGLAWQVDLFSGLFAEAGLGLAAHDGDTGSANRSASATGSAAVGPLWPRSSISRTGAFAHATAASRMWECAWATSSEAANRR